MREYLDSGASQYAGMLAFSLFVSMLPLMLGVVTLWGLVATSRQRFYAARELLVDMFPADAQGVLRQVLLGASEHIGVVAAVSVLAMLWFSTGVFSTIGFALNRIFGMTDRTLVQQRLRGLWLPLALIGAAYLAVGANIGVRLWSVPGVLGLAAILVALTWLVGFLYRLAPSRPLPRSDLWPGASLAAVIIVGLAYAFPLYAQLTSHLGSGTRFFTVVFGLVAWVYCVAHAVLFGAVFNRTRMDARKRQTDRPPTRPQPAPEETEASLDTA